MAVATLETITGTAVTFETSISRLRRPVMAYVGIIVPPKRLLRNGPTFDLPRGFSERTKIMEILSRALEKLLGHLIVHSKETVHVFDALQSRKDVNSLAK